MQLLASGAALKAYGEKCQICVSLYRIFLSDMFQSAKSGIRHKIFLKL